MLILNRSPSAWQSVSGWALFFNSKSNRMDSIQIGGMIVTATVAVFGLLKLKLIEELVKKISSDEKASLYSKFFLFAVVVLLSIATLYLADQHKTFTQMSTREKTKEEKPGSNQAERKKTDLEVKKEIAEKAITTAANAIQQVREKKRQKETEFFESIGRKLVLQIGELTDNSKIILENHKKLSGLPNVTLLKRKKQFVFICAGLIDESVSLDSLRNTFGLSVTIIDLNEYRKRGGKGITTDSRSFGRGKNKIELQYLEVD
jgi:hypothetical protein